MLAARPWRVVKVMLKISELPLSNSSLVVGQGKSILTECCEVKKIYKISDLHSVSDWLCNEQSTKARLLGRHGIIAVTCLRQISHMHYIGLGIIICVRRRGIRGLKFIPRVRLLHPHKCRAHSQTVDGGTKIQV